MNMPGCRFDGLATREGFNSSVRHIRKTIDIVERFEKKANLADVLNELVEDKTLEREELQPIVSMVLKDKYGYRIVSANLKSVVSDPKLVTEAVAKWNGVDMVVLYSHPDIGVVVLNPKNPAHMASLDRLNKTEMVVVYAGTFAKPCKPDVAEKAAESLVALLEGRKVKPATALLKGDCAYRYAAPRAEKQAKTDKVPKAAPARASKAAPGVKVTHVAKNVSGKLAAAAPQEEQNPVKVQRQAEMAAVRPNARMTPMYSVVVANELFHNGNVEAWKRIIDSYNAKYPNLQVLVYYDNERITNLNALFKWGKVKHGSSIQFAVAGEDIKDVAKLQRYLSQGASPMFEAFLRGAVGSVLALF